MNGWGWTVMIFWSLVWIGFLGVIAFALVLWTRGGHPDTAGPVDKTAREMLDERLARGEIDTDEYQRRREAIERHTPVRV